MQMHMRPNATSVRTAAKTGVAPEKVAGTLDEYRDLHDEGRGGTVETRRSRYAQLVNQYYDLATDFYEYGWGQSFHFAPRFVGESLKDSIRRHEHHVASLLELGPSMQVLDVGCGVGGPMRTMARFSGAEVTGINNNAYQLQLAAKHNRNGGLDQRCHLVKGDFLDISLPDASFDAAYEFDALVHAPDLQRAYAEIFRLLRPGGLFVLSDWCMTPRYDPGDAGHQTIKKGIEEGNGLPDTPSFDDVKTALRGAGFEVTHARDLGQAQGTDIPWYRPMTGKEPGLASLRLSRAGKLFTKVALKTLETVKLAPKGSGRVHDLLLSTADALSRGGELGIFTPLYVVRARKPA